MPHDLASRGLSVPRLARSAGPDGSVGAMVRLVDQLQELLGPRGWLDRADATPFLTDFRGDFTGRALGVARPASTPEVSRLLALCAETGTALVTQGGNTGLSGGSVPSTGRPSVVCLLSRMNAIEELHPGRFTVTAQAGVTIEHLQNEARAVNRLFAPDWGARGTATVGGAIATNAGGMNVLRYGNLREQVLGLEVVLPDGQVWDGLRSLPKDNSGYDLKQLFVGSEGTLGVVTRAVLKLHARPAQHASAMAALSRLEALMEFYALARDWSHEALSAFELIPEMGLGRVIERYRAQRPLATIHPWYVLLRLSGGDGTSDNLARLLAAALEAGLIGDAVVAETSTQEQNLWSIRDELSPPRIFDGYMLKYDLAVPQDMIGTLLLQVTELVERLVPGAQPYAFGHVGDGNLHLTIWPADSAPGLLEHRKTALVAAIDDLVWSHRGTISAEHGIGQELIGRIGGQKPALEWDLMSRVKRALDPEEIMNPGKLFPVPGSAGPPGREPVR